MAFDAKKVKDDIIKWIRDWFEVNGKGCNAIVAISGGKDSSVVAALCVEALGKDRVIGVLLPKGEQFDIDVSLALVEHLGIKHYVINIEDCFNGLISQIKKVPGSKIGFVTMKSNKTIYIDPDENYLLEIIKNHQIK